MSDQRRKISRFVLKRYGFEVPAQPQPLWVGTTTIGRGGEADINLTTEFASRRHCQIDISEDQATVTINDNKVSITFFVVVYNIINDLYYGPHNVRNEVPHSQFHNMRSL